MTTIKSFVGKATYDNSSQMIFGADPEGGQQMLLDVRGWGAIQNKFKSMEAAEKFQDDLGEFYAEAINEKLNPPDITLLSIINQYNDFLKRLKILIKWEGEASSLRIMDCRTYTWKISEDVLYITSEEEITHHMRILSPKRNGKNLYMGEAEELTYIMAHMDSEPWDTSELHILDNKNRVI